MNGNLLQGDEGTPQERQKQRVRWLGRKSKQGLYGLMYLAEYWQMEASENAIYIEKLKPTQEAFLILGLLLALKASGSVVA